MNTRQSLLNCGIYHCDYRYPAGFVDFKPTNWGELLQTMQNPREAVVSEETYRTYCQRLSDINDDPSIMRLLFPILQGECNDPAQDGVQFTNLAPFPDLSSIVHPSPAFYHGEKPESLNPHFHRTMGNYIVPSTNSRHAILPTFFVDLSYEMSIDLAEDHALYNGIHGARGIHLLQTSVDSGSVYDAKAYTITVILGGRCLGLYTVHLSKQPDGRDRYHLNLLDEWCLTQSLTAFQTAIRAYRNLRDFTRDERRKVINIANASVG
jgi:hypothetical protein